ncbi:MAG: Uma2 family endonuclease [Candidatus Tectomicrobia bacterium]|uniref:Uma2 family endonuclease n=1 Tax=Tectimicrobiota bacterium TaxID=2528274 RepID=A0A932CM79_UNCTE|nr:Uma2 family endonuclease [Candidatus Tectomicrobia bacterium]
MGMKTLMTGEDLLRMPDEGKRYELVKGELIEMTPPGGEHGECTGRIFRLLDEFVEEHELGRVGVESGFYLSRDPDTVRGPDAFFISKERLDADLEVVGYYEVVPDLVVEVVSPGDTFNEVMDKVNEYLEAGVRLVWIIDTKCRLVVIYPGGQSLTEIETLTGRDVLPGFSVPVSRLFRQKKN